MGLQQHTSPDSTPLQTAALRPELGWPGFTVPTPPSPAPPALPKRTGPGRGPVQALELVWAHLGGEFLRCRWRARTIGRFGPLALQTPPSIRRGTEHSTQGRGASCWGRPRGEVAGQHSP